ncbi:putative N6-adenine methyltransferase domain-containing protein [Trichoderma sp. SZMC 28012]
MSDSDDEPITLSAHALAALKSFEAERDEHQAKFQKLKDEAESNSLLSIDTFQEDWNESQFWYSEETANVLATELLRDATSDMTIGVVSAPSVFVALRNLLRDRSDDEKPKLVLLEHDNRFGVFPEFYFYDFQQPVKLPSHLKGSMDRIIVDPPFLSEDCQTKAALTVRWLLKPSSGGSSPKLIACTGERMESLILKLYKALGVQTTAFEPKHTRGLSNEFYCYANFECPNWKWR